MGFQKIYSKSSQKYGKLWHDSSRLCTQASETPFSGTKNSSMMRQDCTTRVWWNSPTRESLFWISEWCSSKQLKNSSMVNLPNTSTMAASVNLYHQVIWNTFIRKHSHWLIIVLNYPKSNLCSLTFREACTIYTTQKLLLLSYLMEVRFIFFSGNQSELAISNFLKEHWCSGYRAIFALGTLLSSNANLGEDSEHAPCRYRGKNVYCPSL